MRHLSFLFLSTISCHTLVRNRTSAIFAEMHTEETNNWGTIILKFPEALSPFSDTKRFNRPHLKDDGRLCFHRRLSVHIYGRGEGVPIQLIWGWGGQGVPHPRCGQGVSHPADGGGGLGGYPVWGLDRGAPFGLAGLDRGYPILLMGGYPVWALDRRYPIPGLDGGVPHPRSRWGGVPHPRSGWIGVPPSKIRTDWYPRYPWSRLDGGTLPRPGLEGVTPPAQD